MKKNPIIMIPEGLIHAGEELLHFNNDVLNAKNGNDVKPAIEIYTTQTGRMFKVDENNTLIKMTLTHHDDDEHGYLKVSVPCTDGKCHNIKVHRAVLGTFDPLPKEKMDNMTVNHINGKEKDNNDISNLEWLTGPDNTRNAFEQGLAKMLSDDDIREIIKLAEEGYSDEEIGKKFKRAPITITSVRTGRSYYKKRLNNLGLKPVKLLNDITDDIIRDIIKLAKEGKSDREISEILNIPKLSVKLIRGGRVGYDKRIHALSLEPVFTKNVVPLTDDDYIEIMRLAREGVSDEEIGRRFNRAKATIKDIRNGRKSHKEILERLGIDPIIRKTSKPKLK